MSKQQILSLMAAMLSASDGGTDDPSEYAEKALYLYEAVEKKLGETPPRKR